jgi:hypothetical protein
MTALQSRLQNDSQLLFTGLKDLTDLHDFRDEPTAAADHFIQVTTRRHEVLRLCRFTNQLAMRDFMTLEAWRTDMPLSAETMEQWLIQAPPGLRDTVRVRSIYDQAFTEDKLGRKIIQAGVDRGEQAAILPEIPMKMQLADTTAVLFALTRTGSEGAGFSRDGPLVAAMRDYFEMLWLRATKWGETAVAPDCPLTPAQCRILLEMERSDIDSKLAHNTGLALPTVRRYKAQIADALSTGRNWFAAGAEAYRRGWLVPRPRQGSDSDRKETRGRIP